jgi:hypothetical protein
MSEKTTEEKDHERDQVISSMGMSDLNKLSDSQLAMIRSVQMQRMNDNARKRVEKVMEEKMKDVATALTTPPFVFTSPDIRVMAGCVVKFATPITAQIRDAHKQLDKFIVDEQPNELRTTDFLNRHLLAHALCLYNEQDFGGSSFDPADYQGLSRSSPDDAEAMLVEVRNQRLQAIDELSPHIVARLIEYYQAFQLTVESMTRSEDMEDELGN